MINHEPQSVGNVTLESHQARTIKKILEDDFSPLERVPHFRIRLRVRDRDLDER